MALDCHCLCQTKTREREREREGRRDREIEEKGKKRQKLLSGTKQVERNQRCWKFNFEVGCVREREREREEKLLTKINKKD